MCITKCDIRNECVYHINLYNDTLSSFISVIDVVCCVLIRYLSNVVVVGLQMQPAFAAYSDEVDCIEVTKRRINTPSRL